jgi:mono/diheme cytochrome c family protein
VRSENKYQFVLIGLGLLSTLFFGVFFLRELFPEYKLYQNAYIALEEFRSQWTNQPPAPFQVGVKQIVLEREDKGPVLIDRCTTCHVALQIEAYSKTRIAKDANGKVQYDPSGYPIKEENPDYVFKHLEESIAKETSPRRLAELKAMKTVQVGEAEYDLDKVLVMHPLIGKETRPFEYHPIDEWGCTVCHGGNGNGIVTDKAHGPYLDGAYEAEEEGFVPQFLESNPEKDPKFSKIFNAKPGHKLLFQTKPLFVGVLIQAKCAQCHKNSEDPLFGLEKSSSSIVDRNHEEVDRLTKDYLQGQKLFLSQGCYACHRISGLSRGGVGPELTKSGDGYPWFVKQSIVWPQADLKTSTMPNFRLDHVELEPLVAYLLGQTSRNHTMSDVAYKSSVKAWEGGIRLPWEKPIPEKEIVDLNYGLTVFATEGCASCHRLKGFESDVGFKSDDKGAEKWFKKLIPEDVPGSTLIRIIEKEKSAIDQRIVAGIRKDSILEKLQKDHPGVIESFYSNFRFADRAHDELEWKERISRVLKAYIQVYGLGRLICPRPNWSGVFRSDQWLMEHFKNPNALVPHSIMPVFPFDTTKFLALTHMLDVVSPQIVKAERTVIAQSGFNPEEAFEIHCAQCHGENRTGDGPVSTWIYPIPKNLKSAEFLRNLTKERAIDSITHGVKGTPMPPWGEVGEGKDVQPVFTEDQIHLIADWLFSQLPGSTIIRSGEDVPKWQYKTQDVEKELEKSQIFDKVPNPKGGLDKELYYIKERFYTEENIEAGKQFFYTNCAPCHGKEADGAGLRAEAMLDAKPRMLINVDWMNTRDDLRLLRSIKYGVPGTSMTPWGDQTSPLQRLQLVMFIRSLSKDAKNRAAMRDAIYRAFDAKETQALIKQEPMEQVEKIRKEKGAYELVANGFLNLGNDDEQIQLFLDLLKAERSSKQAIATSIIKTMDRRIKLLNDQLQLEGSKIESNESRLELVKLKSEIASWEKQKQLFLTNIRENDK